MYIPTIGLEIHVELKTKTKMFCSCPNEPDEKHPNKNVCPICLGHPGTLPVANKEAILSVIKLGLALGGKIAEHSHFDRKSYFYPDLPKGYQISQYEHPLVEGGTLNDVRLRRIHLEEDTGRLLHEDDLSLVDFNRAGVPLMELVTEPDIKNAEEAVAFARELRLILRYLGISDADMEKGHMRIEANVSVGKAGELGTKVELKNINSFKVVHDAIACELKRQEKLLESGKKVSQETRGWNSDKGTTESQRSKEEAHDYRYFPEPDLPPLDLREFDIKTLKTEILELPEAKRQRFIGEYGLNKEQVEILIEDQKMSEIFEEAVSELKSKVSNPDNNLLYNYIVTDLRGTISARKATFEDLVIKPEHLAHLIAMIQEGKLSSRLAKDILLKMFETGEDPENLMESEKVTLISAEAELREIAKAIIEENPKPAEDYKKGKIPALQALVGRAMVKTRGQADPKVTEKILKELLK
ncbi:MAG: Aspartyl/glutamyl-tRNA(Asn/Gln) amidotransferase subunit B [Candidatus Jorgensenbacteria bacterium GW2011_GWA1_48_13]|uniref:Aspartyl/glutamyl-tRNA(Asn/Gln) amidotransferase subunit B n=2 Tax=Candidatus Joergenseniibacteriota TaxID=1752739 RepID=A0A0G1W8I1_9BACT|nr:MAG: Aspartyl/glutamyl-tRNA(Asn/Gln) amidotransferase subunit B [Candidatus Jorgensenbacteria bacterium GW2011_GWA1_48_13]KKU99339.1 MAG: aspartyl/glutamyl-tRNA amidotransferase subunit B, aspartyl-tRNA(Asn)/glutamyl-tRNA (Gln) amidotransferase subunit B [Candidatus Jorgensenbacteria bacterium GW2011_GWC1_48_8]KKW15023.1 MAG: Aspartyl/glutamyl-tRNA(Asn/Gln) amidotransferase subunit B [Candidatus Jorgensenbacteria bacterium GW2011_GWB1_50_10]